MMKVNFLRKAAVLCLAALMGFALCGAAAAALPRTYAEFKARYQTEGKTPRGAVKMYFEAVFAYLNESTRGEAGKMLRYALHSDVPIERSHNYSTFAARLRDPAYAYIFRSFAAGTSPENSYAMSPEDFELVFENAWEDAGGYLRVALRSSGADSPRVVWVKDYDGLWYVINNAATYVDVRRPKSDLDAKKNAHDADFDPGESLLDRPAGP